MSNEPVPDVILQIVTRCSYDAAASTIPLFAYDNWKFLPAGTGVLLQIDDTRFILTAAHVASGSRRNRLPYWLAPSSPSEQPVPLRDAVTTHTIGDSSDDVDVGVIELLDSVGERLNGRSFVSPATIDVSDRAIPGVYMVMGFPTDSTLVDIGGAEVSSKALRHVTTLRDGSMPPTFDPSRDIVLDYPATSYDGSGEPSPSTNPNGMSGGGIWRLASAGEIANWSPRRLKLVGIQHTWSPSEGYVKGTLMRYAVKLIWDHYSNLRPAIQSEFKDTTDI